MKKQSKLTLQANREAERSRCLVAIRKSAMEVSSSSTLEEAHLERLLADRDFSANLFGLFDPESLGFIKQEDWVGQLKYALNTRSGTLKQRSFIYMELIDLLEALAYLICNEYHITPDKFYQIWVCKGSASKLLKCMDKNMDGDVTVEEFMAFLVTLTSKHENSTLTPENLAWLEVVFRENLKPGQQEFTVDEFKKIVPSKNKYFLERAFTIFDKDKSGTVSLEEFLETMQQFATQDDDDKIHFLFKVYDPNGDGVIDESELCEVLKACMAESGMKFDEKEVFNLAKALYDDSVKEGMAGITADDLKEQFQRHEGLLENLTLNIGKWLVPPKPRAKKSLLDNVKDLIPHYLSITFIMNNRSFFLFSLFLILTNIGLFISRAVHFRYFPMLNGFIPNPFYMLSRACGRTLLFNSAILLVLVLRYSLTALRNLGLAAFLPLDNNILFHKKLGQLIFYQSWLHTIMHLINFGINIMPDPVRFVQLSADYWSGPDSNWTTLGYNPPPGCILVSVKSEEARDCVRPEQYFPNSSQYNPEITICESCPTNSTTWSYASWILTWEPGVFGIIGGIANPTGVALIIILTVITFGSLSYVRRSGYFQVFYFSHLLNFFYWILLILHAPEFWKWIIIPGCIYILEIIYRVTTSFLGHGKSKIISVVTFPSKVTNLIISRPAGFNFNPGDWVFIKIPDIAMFEWHPFTISSAPEVQDTFTVHIRGVGEWTIKLFNYFENNLPNLIENPTTSRLKKLTQRRNPKPPKVTSEFQDLAQQLGTPNSERKQENTTTIDIPQQNGQKHGKLSKLKQSIQIYVDGPFGSPSSNIYRAEHAVLIGTGIGITPFASILQSIMKRYKQVKRMCPNCDYTWSDDMTTLMVNLKKVDFFWINRDQTSFEWFVKLLTELEMEQAETGGEIGRFLDMHMYVTSALQKNDMKAVMLQLAMDLHHEKEKRDLVTGLKSRMNAGRPNWNKVFSKLKAENRGKITVFFCGNPALARVLRLKCDEFGFTFRKEVF
ncbi:NADPH oxidase 5 isoform X3 [Eurytemora carolleeae]|nr:NADPH oxidase 5 isoform X3 [Eurytemora carolleeae]XP_023324718.1 NADPH oxidase 5 isoform X3 [Eurytemora carolleeae]|eukprot:XP_023324717.1 NADPH oxidase 5-like isoform X3 [Eurytemora affinis]